MYVSAKIVANLKQDLFWKISRPSCVQDGCMFVISRGQRTAGSHNWGCTMASWLLL